MEEIRQVAYSTLGRKLLYLVLSFAAMLTVNFLAYNFLLRELEMTASSVDAAGRQRMLSQRIAFKAHLAAAGDRAAATDLVRYVAEFDETLAAFTDGGNSRSFYVHQATPEILPLIEREETIWKTYRAAALTAAAKPGTREALAAAGLILRETDALLAACEAVTAAFRLEAQQDTREMNTLMLLLIAGSLAAGYASVTFAFRKVTVPLLSLSRAADAFTTGGFREKGAEAAGGEIGALAAAFSGMAGRIQRSAEKSDALNRLLAVSMERAELTPLLGRMLDELLRIDWLKLESRGAVFLADPVSRALRLVAQRGLSPEVAGACAEAGPGRCLCGRAALSGETVFSPGLDEKHEVHYEGMPEHGHYCLPIKTGAALAGVLTLYLPPGHSYDEAERVFLETAAGIFAKTIEYKTLEERAFQAQKLESLGKAAGAVAHDFNNILTAIRGFNELVLETAQPGSDTHRYAGEAAKGIAKGSNLVKEILNYSRPGSVERTALDLNALVGGLLPMLEMVMQKKITVEFSPGPELPQVEGTKTQLEQVVMNIAVNARDAMLPKAGRLYIATAAAAGSVTLSIRDTGAGMPPEVQERVFEPFFTTKPEGSGTGLGLATVYTLVKQHNGSIAIESAPGQGTTFHITLPALRPGPEDSRK